MTFAKVTFAGRTLALDTLDGADQSARDMAAGTFEAPLPMLLLATLARFEGAFLDVGANSGVYSVLAGVTFPQRAIHAFEPAPQAVEVLRRNLEANRLGRSVRVHDVALSDKGGTATFYYPATSDGYLETSPTLEPHFHAAFTTTDVVVTRLDEIAGLPTSIAVMKVDIEGHEHAFLAGAYETILRSRPVIFCEVLSIAKTAALTAFFAGLSYLGMRLRPDLVVYEKDVTFEEIAWNHVFVPGEKIQAFKEVCEGCGLAIV